MSLKNDLIAAASVPTGKSKFAGRDIDIRGLTAGEEMEFAEAGFVKNAIPICATCIVEDGKPVFTPKDLTAIKSGILKDVLMDILKLSFPDMKAIEKN